jgi:hypothetical protein
MVKNAISQMHLKRYIIGACGTNNPSCNNLLMYGSGNTPSPPEPPPPPKPPKPEPPEPSPFPPEPTCPKNETPYCNVATLYNGQYVCTQWICVPSSSLPPPECPKNETPYWNGAQWACWQE